MELKVDDTVEEVLQRLATYFIETATVAIVNTGRFNIALAGGSSPGKLYALLAGEQYQGKIDWAKVFFFLGDERYVALTDADSNFRMIKEVLLDPLGIPKSHRFAVDTTLAPMEAAAAYEAAMLGHFNGEPPAFDLVLLGLGDNSHTASLFPHTTILSENIAGVRAVWLPDQQVYRISFTAPLINLAHRVAFLVYGEAKATAVYNVLENDRNPHLYPAQLISADQTEITWFLEKQAASKLTGLQGT